RTFGTKAIENGTNIVTVRQILGHSNVNTTERYLWPEVKQQREAVEAVSAWVDTALNGQQALAADNAEPAQLAEK
ncbi:MAG: site-specific integrase, partial [candidate division NC10 bacterium]|nr:site-specific integrase [candidate division NC10 bacterium]